MIVSLYQSSIQHSRRTNQVALRSACGSPSRSGQLKPTKGNMMISDMLFASPARTPNTRSRIATVSRFLLRVVDRRRRTKAANILAGALGALTNSNAIVRYARRVR